MKLLIATFAALTCMVCAAHASDTLKVNGAKKTISYGKLTITGSTTIKQIMDRIGKPSRIYKMAGVDRIYVYDSLGLSFDIGKNKTQMVEQVYITMQSLKDKRHANLNFKGVLMIDGILINAQSGDKIITSKTSFKELNCFSSLCASNNGSGFSASFNFTNETRNQLAIITFGYKK
ncbi:MAG: hypothetical protein MUC81_07600 [Bacteroidia bacterium]|jgi:hypothetical protein|nr:hypothetical protein [Bacteroidia bacterium]